MALKAFAVAAAGALVIGGGTWTVESFGAPVSRFVASVPQRVSGANLGDLAGRIGTGAQQLVASAERLAGRARAATPKPAARAPVPVPVPASAPASAPAVVASASEAQAAVPSPLTAAPAPAAPPAPPVSLVVPEGTTPLAAGIAVERSGDTARVHFDTPEARTRRWEKFYAMVRRTLPVLYGEQIDSLLPPAEAPAAGALVSDLPVSGLRFALANGWELRLWPETRPGRDGPLVVSYRTTLAR